MPYLIAAVILLGAITILNLLLTLAIIRKLKAETPAPRVETLPELPSGAPVPSFRAVSVSGAEITEKTLAGSEALIAFFDTNCDACKPAIAEVAEYARMHGLRPEQVIAVVGGDLDDNEEYVQGLSGIATVITEEGMGPTTTAFSLSSVPAFCLVGADSSIIRSGRTKTGLNIRGKA